MQKQGFVNNLRASFNEGSQRGMRARRLSDSPLRVLRDSQTLGELSNSRKARGPASAEEEEEAEEAEEAEKAEEAEEERKKGHGISGDSSILPLEGVSAEQKSSHVK